MIKSRALKLAVRVLTTVSPHLGLLLPKPDTQVANLRQLVEARLKAEHDRLMATGASRPPGE